MNIPWEILFTTYLITLPLLSMTLVKQVTEDPRSYLNC